MDNVGAILITAILVLIIASAQASNAQEEALEYELLIYSSSMDLLANMTLIYVPPSNLTLYGAFDGMPKSDLLSILEAPDPSHFKLSAQQISELTRNGVLSMSGWTLYYQGKGAFQLTNGKFVEGPEVLISFSYGSKNAMYDSLSENLIWENFYVSVSSSSGYYFVLTALPSETIEGTPIPTLNLQILDAMVVAITLMAAYSLLTRKRYRIL